MRLTGIAATTNEMTDGRDFHFTQEDLVAMAAQINDPAPPIPVTIDFNGPPVGVVISARVEPDTLHIVVETVALYKGRFAVPAATLKNEAPHDVSVTEIGLTVRPADKTVTPLVDFYVGGGFLRLGFDAGREPGRGEEQVATAAILRDGKVFTLPRPARHGDVLHSMDKPVGEHVQGFVTDSGRFVTREEAFLLAVGAGQPFKDNCAKRLFSEDLW
jgi:hypothetical protein